MRSWLLALVLLTPRLADARCAPTGLEAVVLTPDGTTLNRDDGVVVAADASMTDRSLPDHDVAVDKAWRYRNGKDLVAPVIDVIAPGLAVYRRKGGGTGDIILEDGKRKVRAKATHAKDTPPILGAPKVTKIVATKVTGRRPNSSVEVVLDGDVPETAVAIVAVDAKGKPMSFGRVKKSERVFVYRLGRCQIVTDGTVEPTRGQNITVFWVDAGGRKSPASKVITIAGDPSKDTE